MTKKEKVIKTIKFLVLIIFLLFIFEGALRKWVLPALSGPLYFIKDPLVLWAYFLAFRYKLFPEDRTFKLSVLLMWIFVLAAFFQSVLNELNPLVVLIGIRNYFLLLPLSFLIATYFNKGDLIKLAKVTCYIAVPTAVLIFFQYHSPTDAYINKNVGLDEGTAVFTVGGGIVRPSGFFSFTTGHSIYVVIFVGFLMVNYLLPAKEKFLGRLLYPVLLVLAVFLIISAGSRGLIADVMILVALLIGFSFLSIEKKSSFKVILSILSGGILGYFLITTFFTSYLEVITGRFETASANEDTVYRFFSQYIEMFAAFGFDVPFWGLGLGTGSNAGAFLMTGSRSFITAESEWQSVMAESGPFLGIAFILFRIIISFKVLFGSLKAFKISGSPIPAIFAGIVFMSFLGGQITKQGTEFYFSWIFIGLAMAANNVYLQKEGSGKITLEDNQKVISEKPYVLDQA